MVNEVMFMLFSYDPILDIQKSLVKFNNWYSKNRNCYAPLVLNC